MEQSDSAFDWNDVPILLALAREKSMRKAAEYLSVDVSTVSRRLAAAEKHLQTRLLIRGPNGYEPTDAGRMFIQKATVIDGDMRSLLSVTRAESEGLDGEVRITSVDVLLIDWLIPRLPVLLKIHPELKLRLIPDNHVLSFTRSEADLALRVAKPKEDAAILMRRISHIGMAVYGARRFADTPRSQWGSMPWLSFNEDLSDVQEMKWLAETVPKASYHLRCSSASSLIKACEAGLGLALLPCFTAQSANLVRLSEGTEFKRELWLLRHRDASQIRRFKVVANWLSALAHSESRLLSSE